jgi:hypothetical protein
MISTLKSIYALMLLAGVSLFSWGCKKDKDNPSEKGKKAKITISVSNTFSKADGDNFDLSVTGVNAQGEYVDWKIDGQTEKGTVILIGGDYVNGGKDNMIVESIQNFEVGSVTISGYNITGDPITVSYKIEVNGNVKDEKTVVMKTGDDPFVVNYQL